ncbi:MAG: outer membrane beta-barrel protein [Bacteroidales bacterium]|nr:outer membrane beta-barrel protein [Bacteroidales bacterium]
MKKTLFVALLLLLFTGAQAQVGSDFGVNMYVSAGGGMTIYHNMNNDNPTGFAGGMSVGKWILSPLALNVGVDWMRVQSNINTEGKKSDFVHLNVEFMWDVMSTFYRIRNWRVNAYPMIGLGYTFRDSTSYALYDDEGGRDNDFHTSLGLYVPVRVAQGWDVFAEYKCRFMPQIFDNGGGDVMMHSIKLGVTKRFFNSPYNRRTEYESKNTTEDWFIGFGIGPNFSSFDFEHFNKLSMYSVEPELFFGRNFSNFWTLRFELSGLFAHESYDTLNEKSGKNYRFTHLHADLMCNLSHVINFNRGHRWNFMPYAGAGPIWRYDNVRFDMAADAGLFVRRYINRVGDIYADLRYTMIPPRIAGGTGPSGNVAGDAILSLTFGYVHNFGQSSTRYRIPLNQTIDCAL